ncbi:MAG TPA: hypothetical protein VLX92_31665 [Kofleriaceae bacterium]|nr:hypothetical protein [Kofleriaceae bacterium]
MKLALLAALATGCVVTDPDRVDATWSIATLAGGATACPETWQTARLVLRDGDGGEISDEFPCGAGRGTSSHAAGTAYQATIDMLAADGTVMASSLPASVTPGGAAASFDTTIYLDAGFATMSWSLPPDTDCGGVDPFTGIYFAWTGPTSVTDVFTCDETTGTSSPLAAGNYHVAWSWGVGDGGSTDVAIAAPNRVTVIPQVTF